MKEFHPFRLDGPNQRLWRVAEDGPDEPVVLTPKAFDLLRYMAENPGRLIGHEELLEALWADVHVQPDVIKGGVLAIRTALDDRSTTPRFIETVRGRGYRFVAEVSDGDALDSIVDRPCAPLRMVGRRPALDRLDEVLAAALAGGPEVAFVVGEAGIGKSALVDTFLARVSTSRKALIVRGQCVERHGLDEPYYPLLEIIGRLCQGAGGERVKQELIARAPTWALQLPAQFPVAQRKRLQQEALGAHRDRMLREACDLLEALAQRHPLVLVLEDLHWADYSTIDVLSALARLRSRAPLLVLGTYRGGDAAEQQHPVRQLSSALRLQKLCSEIALGPLSHAEVEEFLTGGADQPNSPGFAQLICDRSGGNPLFMTATLEDLLDRGLVASDQNRWSVRGVLDPAELGVPQTLGQVVEARIQRLSAEERRVLQAAAVQGVTFSADIAGYAFDGGPQTFEDACEDLCRRESFIRHGGESAPRSGASRSYRFDHDIYRQIFYEREGPLRRARVHRLIAQRLERRLAPTERDLFAAELAQHFGASEDWDRAVEYLRRALGVAKERFADQEALHILDQGLAWSARLPDGASQKAELEFLEGKASILAAAHRCSAVETYQRLIDAAELCDEIDVQARAMVGLAYALSWRDQALSVQVLEQALCLSELQTSKQQQARTRMSASVWRIWVRGWCDDDAKRCEEALPLLEGGDDPMVAAWSLVEYSMLDMISSRYVRARETIQRAFQSLFVGALKKSEFNIERGIWMHQLGVPWSLLYSGEIGESIKEFEKGIDLFVRNGNNYAVNTLRLYRGWAFMHCLQFEEVLSICEKVECAGVEDAEAPEQADIEVHPAEQRLCMLLSALAHSGLNDPARALIKLKNTRTMMDEQPVTFDWYWRIPMEWGFTNVYLALGDLAEARAHADRLVELTNDAEERTWRALAHDASARVALGEGDLDGAVLQLDRALKAGDGFSTPLADWRVHATGALVLRKSGDLQSAERHAVSAAETLDALVRSLGDRKALAPSLAAGLERLRPAPV